jgi:hypothetical protein
MGFSRLIYTTETSTTLTVPAIHSTQLLCDEWVINRKEILDVNISLCSEFFLLSLDMDNSRAFKYYMPTFRHTLSVRTAEAMSAGKKPEMITPPMKLEQTGCSETSVYKIQTPGNHPQERTQKRFW